MTQVTTGLTVGLTKRVKYSETPDRYITMHDNPKETRQYNSVDEFIKDFTPTIMSDNLYSRIVEEFGKSKGKIRFKPKGYKANQDFYFKN